LNDLSNNIFLYVSDSSDKYISIIKPEGVLIFYVRFKSAAQLLNQKTVIRD
jgi:hypothetical protein